MKIANPKPPYCSCCFQQKPDKIHVDFEAYFDGPIIEGKDFKQPIDDLIICEDCLRIAGEVIGLGDHKKLLAQRAELNAEVQELRRYQAENEQRLESLRELV